MIVSLQRSRLTAIRFDLERLFAGRSDRLVGLRLAFAIIATHQVHGRRARATHHGSNIKVAGRAVGATRHSADLGFDLDGLDDRVHLGDVLRQRPREIPALDHHAETVDIEAPDVPSMVRPLGIERGCPRR